MSLKNTANTFGSIAKSLHWIIALLIIGMLIFGYFMEDFPASMESVVYNTHKTIGIIILALVVLRLMWRFMNTQPAYSASYPAIMQKLAHLSHYALYIAMFLMPISGWVMSTAHGKIPHFLGWFYFPMPGIPQNPVLANLALETHNTLAIIFIVLLVLHVAAALFHHFILRDNVLIRMLPARRK